MTISREDVKKLAELAQFHLTDEDIARMQDELARILEFVDKLRSIDTLGVASTSRTPTSTWRSDAAFPADDVTREFILSNFPARKGDFLVTPGVFEKPKGSKG